MMTRNLEELAKIIPLELKKWVFAPHPDDEVLGCGGILAKYPDDFFVICMTDGGGSKGAKKGKEEQRKLVEERKKDDILGLMNLKVYNSLYLNHREIKTEEGKSRIKQDLEILLNAGNPEYIFIHSPYEFISKHSEVSGVLTHRIATGAVIDILRKLKKSNLKLFGYEVWDEIPKGPSIFIEDISEQINYVTAAMTAHRTERIIDFIRMKKGRAKTIAATYDNAPDKFQYGERFLDMSVLLNNNQTLKEYCEFRLENADNYLPLGLFEELKGGVKDGI